MYSKYFCVKWINSGVNEFIPGVHTSVCILQLWCCIFIAVYNSNISIMKKLTLVSTFFILAGFIFGQAIQLDIPVDESEMFISTDDSKSDFKKAPYLIFEGINSQMRVIWQLDETASCQISWGVDSTCSLGNAVCEEYGDDHQYGYTISGLTPGTKYFYKVIYDDAVLAASFRTAPPEDASDLKFFVFGDTRSGVVYHEINSGATIDDYTADPEFQTISLFTGDHVTYGAVESNWQNSFFSPNTLNIPITNGHIFNVAGIG